MPFWKVTGDMNCFGTLFVASNHSERYIGACLPLHCWAAFCYCPWISLYAISKALDGLHMSMSLAQGSRYADMLYDTGRLFCQTASLFLIIWEDVARFWKHGIDSIPVQPAYDTLDPSVQKTKHEDIYMRITPKVFCRESRVAKLWRNKLCDSHYLNLAVGKRKVVCTLGAVLTPILWMMSHGAPTERSDKGQTER